MSSDRPNPYRAPYEGGKWWFDDRNSQPHGPYENENLALLALLLHITAEREWRERVDARKSREKSDPPANGGDVAKELSLLPRPERDGDAGT